MKPRLSLLIAFAAGLALWIPALRSRWQSPERAPASRIRAGLASAAQSRESRPAPSWESRLQEALELPEAAARTEMSDLLEAWAEKNGSAALTWAMEHLKPEMRGLTIPGILAQWAWYDPAGVREWYARTKDEPGWEVDPVTRFCREECLIKSLATRDPVMGAEFWTRDFGKTDVKLAGAEAYSNIDPMPDIAKATRSGSDCRQVLEIFEESRQKNPWPQKRDIALIMERWKVFDPGAAAQWGREHP